MTALAIVSAVALAAFLAHELRVEHPVVDLRVFRLRTYAAGVFLMTMVGFVLYGSLVLLPIFLQTLLGYPSLQAGIAIVPAGHGLLPRHAARGHGPRSRRRPPAPRGWGSWAAR